MFPLGYILMWCPIQTLTVNRPGYSGVIRCNPGTAWTILIQMKRVRSFFAYLLKLRKT